MKYTSKQINHFSKVLAEQARRFENIAVNDKSLIGSDTYMLGYELEQIRRCLIDLWIELSKQSTELVNENTTEEPIYTEKMEPFGH